MWYEWLVRGLIGLFACFGGNGKKGKNCHCFMYCDVTSDQDSQNPPPDNSPEEENPADSN